MLLFFCSLKQVWFSSQSLSESASIFLILTTCFFCGIMANFYVNVLLQKHVVYIISRENSTFSYTDAGRCPYDMWPRKRKFLKIVRCPGDYQIRRWCAHRWNRTMSVLFVTIALAKFCLLWRWLSTLSNTGRLPYVPGLVPSKTLRKQI